MTDKTPAMLIAEEILARVADIFEECPEDVAAALALASVSAFAKIYPAKLTAKTKKIIKSNYPDATNELMADRAMTDLGTGQSISTSIISAQIAMDYSPLSFTKDQVDADMAMPPEELEQAQNVVLFAFESVVERGYSPFGAATMMIGIGSAMARDNGTSPFQLLRPLLETALEGIEEFMSPPTSLTAAEEEAVKAVSKQIGISRSALERILKTGLMP